MMRPALTWTLSRHSELQNWQALFTIWSGCNAPEDLVKSYSAGLASVDG